MILYIYIYIASFWFLWDKYLSSNLYWCFLETRNLAQKRKGVNVVFILQKAWILQESKSVSQQKMLPIFWLARLVGNEGPSTFTLLGGGFKHFLFLHLPGQMVQFD